MDPGLAPLALALLLALAPPPPPCESLLDAMPAPTEIVYQSRLSGFLGAFFESMPWADSRARITAMRKNLDGSVEVVVADDSRCVLARGVTGVENWVAAKAWAGMERKRDLATHSETPPTQAGAQAPGPREGIDE